MAGVCNRFPLPISHRSIAICSLVLSLGSILVGVISKWMQQLTMVITADDSSINDGLLVNSVGSGFRASEVFVAEEAAKEAVEAHRAMKASVKGNAAYFFSFRFLALLFHQNTGGFGVTLAEKSGQNVKLAAALRSTGVAGQVLRR